jgi:hypothetical protein
METVSSSEMFVATYKKAQRHHTADHQIPPALTIDKFSFCIYVFRTIRTSNSDYFLKQPLTS